MNLVENWKTIAMRSHSMWAIYLGLLCLWIPEVIFLLFDKNTDPYFWWFAAHALLVYGAVGRLKDQGIGS